MRRFLFGAALIAFAGAAAASAEAPKARYHTMNGRTLVWHAPKTEQAPYALRGQETPKKSEKPRLEIQPHGRSGTSVEIHQDGR